MNTEKKSHDPVSKDFEEQFAPTKYQTLFTMQQILDKFYLKRADLLAHRLVDGLYPG